ncbi:MAG TPA: OmpA family protein [Bryobacteraceae bacterium]|nr:OmpA family protein [Bryobacteraceae bacterium]
MFSKQKITVIGIALLLAMFAAGCKKKAPPPPPPPPPRPADERPVPSNPNVGGPAPVIAQFTAEPTSIQRGQSSTLRWEISGNVTSVTIDQGIGAVQNVGSRRVFPSDSVTYTLTATGPGGNTTASAIVSVTSPMAPPPPNTGTGGAVPLDRRLETDLQDIYFDYDKTDIDGEARDTLNRDAQALKGILTDFPGSSIVLEGHCDERGSAEYNLGLGDRRASAAKDFLVQLGVPADRIKTISYGKERPQCGESTEACWQKNRRVHFSPGQ